MYIPLISDFISCMKTPSNVWKKEQQEKFDIENEHGYSDLDIDMVQDDEGIYTIKESD